MNSLRINDCSAAQVRALATPRKKSRKGDNGILVLIGGSKEYHGAPIHAMRAAAKFVDLVYYYSPFKLNCESAKLLRLEADVITVDRKRLRQACDRADALLIGPGLGASQGRMVNNACRQYSHKKIVLDASALPLVDSKLLNSNCLLTPHAGEFAKLFGVAPSAKHAFDAAKQFGCTILLKDRAASGFDWVTDGKSLWRNGNGNAFMTKGGTGDVLAGLAAAFACKNPLARAACAAAFLNGAAGDTLASETHGAFSATDLANAIPRAYAKAIGPS